MDRYVVSISGGGNLTTCHTFAKLVFDNNGRVDEVGVLCPCRIQRSTVVKNNLKCADTRPDCNIYYSPSLVTFILVNFTTFPLSDSFFQNNNLSTFSPRHCGTSS